MASLATHINLIEKEDKDTRLDSAYLKKSTKEKQDTLDRLVNKKDIKPLKLL